MKFYVEFYGRENGAIGMRSYYARTVNADSENAAILKLYENFEHISVCKIEKIGGDHESD